MVNSNNICSECYKSCETCFQGANSKACLTCKEGYILKANECIDKNRITPKMSR